MHLQTGPHEQYFAQQYHLFFQETFENFFLSEYAQFLIFLDRVLRVVVRVF